MTGEQPLWVPSGEQHGAASKRGRASRLQHRVGEVTSQTSPCLRMSPGAAQKASPAGRLGALSAAEVTRAAVKEEAGLRVTPASGDDVPDGRAGVENCSCLPVGQHSQLS